MDENIQNKHAHAEFAHCLFGEDGEKNNNASNRASLCPPTPPSSLASLLPHPSSSSPLPRSPVPNSRILAFPPHPVCF